MLMHQKNWEEFCQKLYNDWRHCMRSMTDGQDNVLSQAEAMTKNLCHKGLNICLILFWFISWKDDFLSPPVCMCVYRMCVNMSLRPPPFLWGKFLIISQFLALKYESNNLIWMLWIEYCTMVFVENSIRRILFWSNTILRKVLAKYGTWSFIQHHHRIILHQNQQYIT